MSEDWQRMPCGHAACRAKEQEIASLRARCEGLEAKLAAAEKRLEQTATYASYLRYGNGAYWRAILRQMEQEAAAREGGPIQKRTPPEEAALAAAEKERDALCDEKESSENVWTRDALYDENTRLREDLRAVEAKLAAVLNAWDSVDAGRGWLGCVPPHDCRCERLLDKNGCVCGHDALIAALDAARKPALDCPCGGSCCSAPGTTAQARYDGLEWVCDCSCHPYPARKGEEK